MDKIILEMRGITKTFPGVKALDNVNFKVREGEIHALVGENGAGKSTLMKVLSGVYPAGTYEGDIFYDGEVRRFNTISDSEHLGIIIIHQELALVPLLSIAENIFLGNEMATNGVIDWPATFSRTQELLTKVGLRESATTLITDIGVGKQQLVEIAKALSKKVRLLILDEPTASLNETDSDALLKLLVEFRKQGMTSIIISHKLNEIRKVADQITILRDGGTVETLDAHTEEVSEDRIIKGMVGREMEDRYPARDVAIGETLLEVKNWNVFHQNHRDRQFLHNVNFNVRAGEVVGIAGLMGAGRTETAMSVFGKAWGHKITGEVSVRGKRVDVSTIPKAIDAGLAYVTEDRKQLGLVLINNIMHNTTLANLKAVANGGVIDNHAEAKVAIDYRTRLRIRSHSIYQEAVNLSGGNQQKVVLSKWLFTNPEVLILDEPTRGIDVGAKYEIYTIINQLAAEGKGILMISSEMPELLGTCDRIYVMNEGRIVAELSKQEASQESIMRAIMRSGEKH
ncbi:MAG: putative ATP-binding component of transporter protein [Rhizobium sp.]|nr:putative ATP-binding component of transporter protein [Rhizobium sp.]